MKLIIFMILLFGTISSFLRRNPGYPCKAMSFGALCGPQFGPKIGPKIGTMILPSNEDWVRGKTIEMYHNTLGDRYWTNEMLYAVTRRPYEFR